MKHYPHNIGDFNSATRHLTVVERAFYRELIELYYQTEQPIPAGDLDKVARLCLAQSDAEKAIVKAILSEFFILDGDVYRHTRCDAEILVYQDKIKKSQHAGRMSVLTRAKRTLNERSTVVQPTTNDERLTTNDERQSNKRGQAAPKPAEVPDLVWNDFLKLRKTKKAAVTETAIEVLRNEGIKAGMSLDEVLKTCCANGWQGFKADWVRKDKKKFSLAEKNKFATDGWVPTELRVSNAN